VVPAATTGLAAAVRGQPLSSTARRWRRRQTAKIPGAAWLLRGMVIAAGFAATIYLLVLVGLASGLRQPRARSP
jgi:hypothetical protein